MSVPLTGRGPVGRVELSEPVLLFGPAVARAGLVVWGDDGHVMTVGTLPEGPERRFRTVPVAHAALWGSEVDLLEHLAAMLRR